MPVISNTSAMPGVSRSAVSLRQSGRGLFNIRRLHSHDGRTDAGVIERPAVVGDEDAARAESLERSSVVAPPSASPQWSASSSSASAALSKLPGSYGWDPLGLVGSDPSSEVLSAEWLSYAELIHGRWAMIAAVGALAPEILGLMGVIPQSTALPWFVSGGLNAEPGTPAVPFCAPIPFQYWTDQISLLWTMLVAMGFAETRRLQDWRSPGSMSKQYFLGLESAHKGSGEPAYPGGSVFNLFNLGNDEASRQKLRTAEVKHSRVAMIAWAAFLVQAQTTHRGPVQNIFDHIADPSRENLLARVGEFANNVDSTGRAPFLIWLVAGIAVLGMKSDVKTASSTK